VACYVGRMADSHSARGRVADILAFHQLRAVIYLEAEIVAPQILGPRGNARQ